MLALGAGGAPADEVCEQVPEPRTLVQRQTVTVHGEGWARETVREVYWKRFGPHAVRVLLHVVAPAAERGLRVLVDMAHGRDPVLHVYTPDTGRARRMVGSGASNSVLGTDLTYEDAKHLEEFLTAPDSRPAGEAEVDGRAVRVLERRPAAGASAYGRIVTAVDPVWCVPLLVEFFGRSGELRKTVVAPADAVKRIGGLYVPHRLTVVDHERGSRTEFVVDAARVNEPLADRLFTATEIARSH